MTRCRLLKAAAAGLGMSLLRGVLATVLATSIGTAQSVIEIKPGPADVVASGIKLVAANDPEYAATLQTIIADDASSMAPLLPYSVLVTNGSTQKLRAISVNFQWKDAEESPRGRSLTLTAMTLPEDPTELTPGGIRLITPVQIANQYIAVPPANRKTFLQNAQLAGGSGNGTATQISSATLPTILQKQASALASMTDFRAFVEGVVFDDFSYVGSENLLTLIQRGRPEVHR
jgi:hypothetical protein